MGNLLNLLSYLRGRKLFEQWKKREISTGRVFTFTRCIFNLFSTEAEPMSGFQRNRSTYPAAVYPLKISMHWWNVHMGNFFIDIYSIRLLLKKCRCISINYCGEFLQGCGERIEREHKQRWREPNPPICLKKHVANIKFGLCGNNLTTLARANSQTSDLCASSKWAGRKKDEKKWKW